VATIVAYCLSPLGPKNWTYGETGFYLEGSHRWSQISTRRRGSAFICEICG